MRHSQLITGLRNLGLESEKHYLSIIEIVADLMNIRQAKREFIRPTYYDFLNKVENYPITDTGKELIPLAEECYRRLLE